MYEVSTSTALQLFDSFVGSVLNYLYVVWEFSKSKNIECLRPYFVNQYCQLNTCNAAVYNKLIRYPLFIKRYDQIIKYWLKIIHSDNIILKKSYVCSSRIT